MNAVLDADETTFEEAEPILREELAAARARRVIDDAREAITDLMAGGAQIEDIVDQSEMERGSITWTAETRDGIAAYDAFRAAAAAVNEGDFPELIELADGGVFTLRLDGVSPPALRPLEDVREAVADAWQVARVQQAVMEEATLATEALGATTGFETQGLIASSETGLTRRSFVDGTPPGFMEQVFDLEVGDVTTIDAGTFGIVLRLDSAQVPAADNEAIAADRDAVLQTATVGIAQDIFDIYNNELQRQTEVSINPSAITAVHAAFQ
jgi:peptidyl-prolyl cis-trans isomerase D